MSMYPKNMLFTSESVTDEHSICNQRHIIREKLRLVKF